MVGVIISNQDKTTSWWKVRPKRRPKKVGFAVFFLCADMVLEAKTLSHFLPFFKTPCITEK